MKIYSNCDRVQLVLNGVSQSSQTSTNHIFDWGSKPLVPGTNTLVAIGSKGAQTSTDTVVWVGANAVNLGGSQALV